MVKYVFFVIFCDIKFTSSAVKIRLISGGWVFKMAGVRWFGGGFKTPVNLNHRKILAKNYGGFRWFRWFSVVSVVFGGFRWFSVVSVVSETYQP